MANDPNKRSYYSLEIGRLISKVVKPIMRQRGFYDVDILSEWENIIGAEWAKQTCPQKLSFNSHSRRSGILHILVSPGASVLIQHIQPMIIDRVNTYFGYEAIQRLKIIHGHVPILKKKSSKNNGDSEIPLPTVEGITDPELKSALQNLGQGLIKEKMKT
ncbi:MAG: DUF721 domain-containing protein [Alphaproteobacteria bacterium]|nr:DUF721 domain-containing protein [Alphaproteobacteria bacterium]